MDKAVAVLCDTWPQDSKANPRITAICRTIRELRLKARGIDTSKPFEVRQAEAILHRTTEDDSLTRWDLICGISDMRSNGKHHIDWAPHLFRYAIANGGLTIPYWAATEDRRKVFGVVERDEYISRLDEPLRSVYNRMYGLSIAKVAQALRCVPERGEVLDYGRNEPSQTVAAVESSEPNEYSQAMIKRFG